MLGNNSSSTTQQDLTDFVENAQIQQDLQSAIRSFENINTKLTHAEKEDNIKRENTTRDETIEREIFFDHHGKPIMKEKITSHTESKQEHQYTKVTFQQFEQNYQRFIEEKHKFIKYAENTAAERKKIYDIAQSLQTIGCKKLISDVENFIEENQEWQNIKDRSFEYIMGIHNYNHAFQYLDQLQPDNPVYDLDLYFTKMKTQFITELKKFKQSNSSTESKTTELMPFSAFNKLVGAQVKIHRLRLFHYKLLFNNRSKLPRIVEILKIVKYYEHSSKQVATLNDPYNVHELDDVYLSTPNSSRVVHVVVLKVEFRGQKKPIQFTIEIPLKIMMHVDGYKNIIMRKLEEDFKAEYDEHLKEFDEWEEVFESHMEELKKR